MNTNIFPNLPKVALICKKTWPPRARLIVAFKGKIKEASLLEPLVRILNKLFVRSELKAVFCRIDLLINLARLLS